jgi:hypothetical protein
MPEYSEKKVTTVWAVATEDGVHSSRWTKDSLTWHNSTSKPGTLFINIGPGSAGMLNSFSMNSAMDSVYQGDRMKGNLPEIPSYGAWDETKK